MKVTAYCCAILSTLLVVAWPVAAFGSIFLFDAPTRDALYEFKRFFLFIGVITYPWGYLVAIARIFARRKGEVWWTRLTIVFFLVPFGQLGLVFLVASIFGS
jgi:hypothetical protein